MYHEVRGKNVVFNAFMSSCQRYSGPVSTHGMIYLNDDYLFTALMNNRDNREQFLQ